MNRVEKTVFISYRRTDESWGLAVFQDLTQHGYDVFIDYDGIASGKFEAIIFENIRARAHFLVLLTPTALERCGDPKDWMRREIEAALDSQRNIVPLMFTGFDFDAPATASRLTGKLAALKEYNGLPIPKGYFSQAMERLRNRFLNVPIDAVLHPASDSAQQVAKEQKDKATMALGKSLRSNKIRKLTLPFVVIGLAVFGWNYWAYSVRDEFSRAVSISCSYKWDPEYHLAQRALVSIVMINNTLDEFNSIDNIRYVFLVDGKEWSREHSFSGLWEWSTSSGRTTRKITGTYFVDDPPPGFTAVKVSFDVGGADTSLGTFLRRLIWPSVGTTDCVAAK
jgi:hypothetical protein